MKIIVGLGNIGSKYDDTRHNAGFLAIDKVAQNFDISFQNKKKLDADIASFKSEDLDFLLVKPTTFMNDSGIAVKKILNFYSADVSDLIILVDDLDRPLGKIRMRMSGSSGGQNGLNSINNHLGTDKYKRIRIGIGRPEHKNESIVNYVLGKFPKEDEQLLEDTLTKVSEAVNDLLKNEPFNKVASKYNN